MDESRGEQDASLNEDSTGGVCGYSESALHQPSLTDLIPVHPLRVFLTVVGSFAALVGLLVLDDWASADRNISAFQLGEPGSLASWVASTMLLWAASGAVLTFLIRRHRKDDYRGTYYIWIWAAAMLVVASISATTPWHREWNAMLSHLTTVDLGPDGWWMATAGAAGLLMIVRIGLDLRPCRLALLLLLTALAGYVATGLVQTNVLLAEYANLKELTVQCGVLASHLTLAYALWWNARFVQLDARGVHAERAARRAAAKAEREQRRSQKLEEKQQAKEEKAAKRKKPADGDDEEEEVKPPRASTKSRRKSKHVEQEPEDSDEDAETVSLEEGRKSKAERRRDRKQKRRMAA